jgi:hypothetical protein
MSTNSNSILSERKIPVKKILISEYEENHKLKGSELEPLTLKKIVKIIDTIKKLIGSVITFVASICFQAENETDFSTTHCRNSDRTKTCIYYGY